MWKAVKREPEDMELERSDDSASMEAKDEGAVGGVGVRKVKAEPLYIDDEEWSYSDIRLAEKAEFLRKAKSLGWKGDLTTGKCMSKLVTAARTGQLGDVPDPVTAGILEQMEKQVCI